MNKLETVEILANAFCEGEIDALEGLLADNSKYYSDYAQRSVTSPEAILDNMRRVHSVILRRVERGENCKYRYIIIDINNVLKDGVSLDDLHGDSFFDVCDKGFLLFQYDSKKPVAVVFIKTTPNGMISEITLSRNHKWFDIKFYGESDIEDSAKDIPYTVKPMTSHDYEVKALQAVFTYQNHEKVEYDDPEIYIWRKADEFIKEMLSERGYSMIESRIFDDCIGYRCNHKNKIYTIYMYAYGQTRSIRLDGEICAELLERDFSGNSTVLVVYLNVHRYLDGNGTKYSVRSYSGNDDSAIEFWRVTEAEGQKVLVYYPGEEILDLIQRLMYAFNCDDRDVYDCIVCDHNPSFKGADYKGYFMNEAFYNNLFRIHREYGDMKIGYVRYNDVIYSQAPYIDGYGFFGINVDEYTNKINNVTAMPFDDEEHPYAEFIRTQEKEDGTLYQNIPHLISVKPMAPMFTERFALKLGFDNGECKKYVLPIASEVENDEVIKIHNHVFTDKIWSTAKAKPSDDHNRGMAVCFANGYAVSVLKCYEEGNDYSEPEMCAKKIYEDSEYYIEKCWTWNVEAMYEDEETGLLKTLISGNAFNTDGISTFVPVEGKRLCSIDFDYIDDFSDGLAKVGKKEYGYGFIDREMNLVIPMKYENADRFMNGVAKVKKDGSWLYIDKRGNETDIQLNLPDMEYQEIGEFHEGMCKVSTLKLGFMDLAYYSDYENIAGIWGFVNEQGKEIIPPQFIYAEDFYNGVAFVCKGEWTIDKKWDNKYNSGRYWTETEMWGAIDKEGNEVIPFIFDEIKHFWDTEDVFIAHYGGWDNGHWGVIDNRGNWLAEPIFEDIDYEYKNGLFAFYKEDRWDDDVPLGIYDTKQKKVIFEPQFLDVSFIDDDWIKVEVFDDELGRNVEKIIDINGKERFHSIYSSIRTWKKPYEVIIRDSNGESHGLIDEDGTVILPCQQSFDGISYEKKLIKFEESGNQGLQDFEGNVILNPKFYEIRLLDKPVFIIKKGNADNYVEGMVNRKGEEIIPAFYRYIHWLKDDYFVCCGDEGCGMYRFVFK